MTQAENSSSDSLVWLNCVEPLEEKPQRTPHSVMIQLPKDAVILNSIADSDAKENSAKLFRLTVSEQVSAPFSAEFEFFSYYPLDLGKILSSDNKLVARAIIAFSASKKEGALLHYLSGYLADITSRGVVMVQEDRQSDDFCKYYYSARIASVQELLTHSLRRRCFVGYDLNNMNSDSLYREVETDNGQSEKFNNEMKEEIQKDEKEAMISLERTRRESVLKDDFNVLTVKLFEKLVENNKIEVLLKGIFNSFTEENSNIKADVDFLWYDDNAFRPVVNMATQFDETDANFLARMAHRYGYYWVGYFPPIKTDSNIREESTQKICEKIRFTNMMPQNLSILDDTFFTLSYDPSECEVDKMIKFVSFSKKFIKPNVVLKNTKDIYSSFSYLAKMDGDDESSTDYYKKWRYNEEICTSILINLCLDSALNTMKEHAVQDKSARKGDINNLMSNDFIDILIKSSKDKLDKYISDFYKNRTQYICAMRENEIASETLIMEGRMLISADTPDNYKIKVGQPFKILVPVNGEKYIFLDSILGDQYEKVVSESQVTFMPTQTQLKLVFVLPEVAGIQKEFRPATERRYSENTLSITAHVLSKKMQENPYFFPPPEFKSVKISGLLRAEVCQSTGKSAVPVIDKYGYYKLKYSFPVYYINSNIEEKGVTLPVPLVTYTGGSKTNATPGLYMPLINGSNVLIAFQEGDPDMPFIIGTTADTGDDAQQKAIFSSAQQSILQTHRGVSVRMNYSQDKS
ncbi:MAG: hypothetical protein ABF636_00190 [Acetobacter sp.]